MIRNIFILLFFTFGYLTAFSQGAFTWEYLETTHSAPFGGTFNEIVRISGNGYLMTGSIPVPGNNSNVPIVSRINDQGQELWTRRYDLFLNPPFSGPNPGAGATILRTLPTSDGGFLSGVSAQGRWLVKFDASGDTMWSKQLNSAIINGLTTFDELADGNLLYNAAIPQSSPATISPNMIRTDAAGNPLDSTTYTGLPYMWLSNTHAANNEQVYLNGMDSTFNFSVVQLDSAGAVQWTNNYYQHNYNRPATPQGVETASDSSITLAVRRPRGNSWPDNYRAAFEFHNIAQTGNQNWRVTLPDAFGVSITWFPASMAWTIREDGVTLVTVVDSLTTHLFAISPTGAPLWNRLLPEPPNLATTKTNDICPGVENTAGFATTGTTRLGNFPQPYAAGFDSLGDFFHVRIEGTVFVDSTADCIQDPGEPGMANSLLMDDQGNPVAVTDPNGLYSFIRGTGTHTYTVFPVANNWLPFWDITCPVTDSQTVTFNGVPAIDTAFGRDFAVETLIDCPLMVVDVAVPFLRPCSLGTYTVNYCNHGSATASNAYVVLALDSALNGFNTAMPFTSVGQDSFQVNLGNLAPGQCGQFQFTVMPPCTLPFQPTSHCVVAHAFPDSLCLPPPAAWNGAEVAVQGWCAQNDTVIFQIKNVGTAAMAAASGIWVVEDDILRQMGQVQLGQGQDTTLFVPANGATWTTLVDQVPDFPWPSIPRASVEACGLNGGGGFSTGFVTAIEDDDRMPWRSIACMQLTTAVDPNDKTGFPTGFGANRQIYANGEMEYLIRFQNTGTDTAFTVTIKDTLPPDLELSSFISGASSHAYSVAFLPGNVAQWTFRNILLPDSTTDEANSHGFVKFRMMQKPNLTAGTRIENEAGIIFDFMPPLLTNLAFHTIGELELTVNLDAPNEITAPKITVYPNPCAEVAHFDLGQPYKDLEIGLYDLNGRLLRLVHAGNARLLDLNRDGLPAGMYVFRIAAQGEVIGSGKLIVGTK